MTEQLLQYIWQFQLYHQASLSCIEAENVQIISPGQINHNEGPDFLNAKIIIGKTIWVGSIELHINSSNWKHHKHAADENYKNVILHVVWHHDADLGLRFPTLELQQRVSKILLSKYEELMTSPSFIPCEKNIHELNAVILQSWKESLLVERLLSKSQLVFEFLEKNKGHWDETFWWMIAKNFGTPVNSEAFLEMAQTVSLNLLTKHKQQLYQIEALLFGQSGLLEKIFSEDHPISLQKEYRFLKQKYRLKKTHQSMMFLRMRPSNFPSVRLAQLAMLIHRSDHLFSKIREFSSLKEIKNLLTVKADDYWDCHYLFDEPAGYKKKNLGDTMINSILINTVVPLVFAYGRHQQDEGYQKKAMDWLEEIKAESNAMIKRFSLLGVPAVNASDTQALVQLKNVYCNKKRCLECRIGFALLRKY